MTITTYENLNKWFVASKGNKPAPYWNLYSLKYGRTDQVVHRNVDVSDLAESARLLEEAVRMLSPGDEPARFKVSVYPEGAANNPLASVEVQIRNTAPAAVTPAGVSGLPAGVGSINEYISERLRTERLQWELDQLKEQLNAPSDKWERVLETVSGIQGIDKVLQTALLGLVSKFVPNAMPDIMRAINGIPDAPAPVMGGHADDDEADPTAVFSENIQAASTTLGTDPVTLARKLNALVRQNPELAKQILQQ